jgi:hypothetical protein
MRVVHEKAIVTDDGIAFVRGPVYGNVLSEYVIVADNDSGRFTIVFEVLRLEPDGDAGKNPAILANRRISVNYGVRTNPGAGTNFHMRTDYGKRPYFGAWIYDSPLRNEGSLVDQGGTRH